MYKAIVFAGTTEGYEISRFLSENKVSVLACVATEYGSRSLEENEFLSIRAERYSQTASKAEQIALCQFIRDGHLTSQTKKLKKLYAQKLKALENEVRNTFGRNCTIQTGAAGTSLALTIPYARTGLELKKEARMHGMSLLILEENAATITILLSCSSITTDDFAPACQLLSRLLNK